MPDSSPNLQVAPLGLFPLDGFKQTLEIPSAETVEVIPLDDLDEHSRPVHQWLREKLQEISAVIEVDEDVEPL